ncbi:hypothetical protein AGMMS50230_04160 [Spirochaetia bacterium]|nr:hypothetical protein AGMMS50230_04160 [Spirochaetia bacterium]
MKQFLLKEEPVYSAKTAKGPAGGPGGCGCGVVKLRGEDYHYLVHVLRLKPGDVFNALLPNGLPVTVTVTGSSSHTLTGEISAIAAAMAAAPAHVPAAETNSAPSAKFILFQALPKGAKMDLIVRQAAELGISEVVPFAAERSVPGIKARRQNREETGREERWRRIVKEARQQSGSCVDTRVLSPLGIDALFAYWEKLRSVKSGDTGAVLGLIFHPLAQGNLHQYLYREPVITVLAVGPEGGFSGAELDRFTSAGFKSLNLGDTVLRTETAALYGAAAVKMILMERSQWTLKQTWNESPS